MQAERFHRDQSINQSCSQGTKFWGSQIAELRSSCQSAACQGSVSNAEVAVAALQLALHFLTRCVTDLDIRAIVQTLMDAGGNEVCWLTVHSSDSVCPHVLLMSPKRFFVLTMQHFIYKIRVSQKYLFDLKKLLVHELTLVQNGKKMPRCNSENEVDHQNIKPIRMI